MKLFIKLLTLISIAVAGTGAWAESTEEKIALIKESHKEYLKTRKNLTEARASGNEKKADVAAQAAADAMKKLETVCDEKCTRFSCKGEDMTVTCATSCRKKPIKNCMGDPDKQQKILDNKQMKFDDLGIPRKE